MSVIKQVNEKLKQNQPEEAYKILIKAIEKEPNFKLYQSKLIEISKKLSPKKNDPIIQKENTIGHPLSPNNNLDKVENLAKQRKTAEARKIAAEIHKNYPENINSLLWLCKLDMIDGRFGDALKKAEIAISKDRNNREGYRLAEQAAIELGEKGKANNYYLKQPPIINPEFPQKRGPNSVLPKNFILPDIVGLGNDYRSIILKRNHFLQYKFNGYTKIASIIIATYNRHDILAKTLAALTHQTYPNKLLELIVVDDGSDDEIFKVIKKYESNFNLRYCRQPDTGFKVSAARNLGLKIATGDAIILIDADILPLPSDIEKYMQIMHVTDDAVLIGHRRYVDTSKISDDEILKSINTAIDLPSINPNNDVADRRNENNISVDWRLETYKNNNYLLSDKTPFTKGAGGNLAFSKKILTKSGLFDEEFINWGCEDIEFSYRLFEAGAYFIPLIEIVSLHQEPINQTKLPEGQSFRAIGHEITKNQFADKCPSGVIRRYLPGLTFTIPKVSIYIPAYNAEKYLKQAIDSCLTQNFGDLEVCVCNDGSTDGTEAILQSYANNKKVRWVSQPNRGIGAATNAALALCRGMYIAQLDADDVLKQGAVRECVSVLETTDYDAVYTDCDYIDSKGEHIRNGWCGGEFSREWMATGMIATHFRMFKRRLLNRTSKVNESIRNAVDLDLWLRLYEKGTVTHLHKVMYSYRWHGDNTSIQYRKDQEVNHLKVVAESLNRQDLARYWQVTKTDNALNPREFTLTSKLHSISSKDIFVLIISCQKYVDKADAIRQTWAQDLRRHGYRYLFLMGDPTLKEAKIDGDNLIVACRDDYESLILKLFLAYDYLAQVEQFDYIYKIDDDCILNVNDLTNGIIPQLPGNQYIGGATHPKGAPMNNKWHFDKCSSVEYNKPYPFEKAPFEFAKGGYGYFLRKDILKVLQKEIYKTKMDINNFVYYFEDVRISELLGVFNIYVKKLNNYSCVRFSEDLEKSKATLIFDCPNKQAILSKYNQIIQ
jgi:glycosyltransferase involved in cell wall biosynthesis